MSIFDGILGRAGYLSAKEVDARLAEIKATVPNPPAWLRARSEFERVQDINLWTPKKQAELYNRLSWVNMAIKHVAGQVSGTPFQVLEQDENEEKKKILNHEFEVVLRRPNPTQSRLEILTDTASNYMLTGNAFWWMNKANETTTPDEIFTIPTHMIRPVPDGNMFLEGYVYDPGDGKEIALMPWEVVHFKTYNPFSRYWGLSSIAALAVVAIGDLAMQKHNTEFFTGLGAKLPGMLAFKSPIAQPEWDKIKADMKTNSEKRNLMLLRGVGPDGVDWVKIGMSQAEMEFIEGRKMNKEEIFGVLAPGLFSWLEPNATEANARAGKEAFDELGVWPINQAIQEKITVEILPLYGENLVGEFDDVRPVDKQIKISEQNATKDIMTIDEQRKKFLNLDPLEDSELGGQIVSMASTTNGEPNPFDEDEEDEETTREEEEERTKFRRYTKRHGDGEDFIFYHLNENQQEALKAEMGSDNDKRLDLLIKLSDLAKASVSV